MKLSETSILSLVFENIPAVTLLLLVIRIFFSGNLYIVSLVNVLFRFLQIKKSFLWRQIGFSRWELIFAIFTKYPVPSIDNIFVFVKYVYT